MKILFLLLLSTSLWATTQSIRVTSGTPTATIAAGAPGAWASNIGVNSQPMRFTGRIHNFSLSAGDLMSLLVTRLRDFAGTQLGINIEGSFNFDVIQDNGIGINCCSQWAGGDVLWRAQRFTTGAALPNAGSYWSFELCPLPPTDGACVSATRPLTNYGTVTDWRGYSFTLSGSPSTYSLAFLRWFSTTVPIGSSMPLVGETGDLADWEFEGVATDSAHGTDFTGGVVTYVSTPAYAPSCNAGAQQSFRAGGTGTLDGSGSTPLDGGSTLTYKWQQTTSQALVWSSHTTVAPTLTGMIFGPVNISLAVTDGSNQTSTCSVHHGAVATDSSDNVVIADPIVRAILSPLLRYGSSNNPWPWFDTANKYSNDYFGALLAGPNAVYGSNGFTATWEVPAAGTISVPLTAPGVAAAVTGVGTSFLTDVCIAAAPILTATATSPITLTVSTTYHFLNGDKIVITGGTGMAGINGSFDLITTSTPGTYQLRGSTGTGVYNASSAKIAITHDITIWWPNITGVTGHRYIRTASCADATHLTSLDPYYNYANSVDLASNSGNIVAAGYALNSDPLRGVWINGSSNANYYMQDLGYLLTYYRTGIDTYLGYFNTLAPRWFQSYGIDWGTTADGVIGTWGTAFRSQALIGPMLYAYLTDSTYWSKGLYTALDYLYGLEPTSGVVGDIREEGAANAYLAVASYLGLVNGTGTPGTDQTKATAYAVRLDQNMGGRWLPNQRTNKEWVAENFGFAPWNNCGGCSVTAPAVGGTAVTMVGGTYDCTTADVTNGNVRIWFTASPTDFNLANGDTASYHFTCSGAAATTFTLTVPYAGTHSGAGRGFLIGGVDGQITQPFMIGYLGSSMQLVYLALNEAYLNGIGMIDAAAVARPKQFVQDTAAWNMNTTYGGTRSFANGLWYARNGLPTASPVEPCEPPETTDPYVYALDSFACSGDTVTNLVSSATQAASAVLTCPSACLVSPGDSVHIWQATGNWTGINTTFVATAGSGSTFTIPFNSSFLGPLTGNVLFTNRNLQIPSSRFLAGEIHRSVAQSYLFNASAPLKTAFDCMFGGMWGGPDQVGTCADANYLNDYLPNSFDYGRNYAKINGFAFGWGAGAQWPAARLGGVTPNVNRTLHVGFALASVPNATQVRLTLTKPDGTTVQATCASSPCSIVGDARQANHLLEVEFLSAGSAVLARRPVALPVGVQ